MKKIHRVLALLMAVVMVLGLITTAFAEPTIDPAKNASLSMKKAICIILAVAGAAAIYFTRHAHPRGRREM